MQGFKMVLVSEVEKIQLCQNSKFVFIESWESQAPDLAIINQSKQLNYLWSLGLSQPPLPPSQSAT